MKADLSLETIRAKTWQVTKSYSTAAIHYHRRPKRLLTVVTRQRDYKPSNNKEYSHDHLKNFQTSSDIFMQLGIERCD